MTASEITVGGKYYAKVSGRLVTVRVDAIRVVTGRSSTGFWFSSQRHPDKTVFDVTNLATGLRTTFRSTARFRGTVEPLERP